MGLLDRFGTRAFACIVGIVAFVEMRKHWLHNEFTIVSTISVIDIIGPKLDIQSNRKNS